MELNIYLFFNGNCEEAINFYKKALNGEVVMMQRYKDAPTPYEEAHKDMVMHAVLKMETFVMMFSDAVGQHEVSFGTNYSLSLNFHDQASIDATYLALCDGGNADMELQDTFWGARFGMCTDKFGVKWMLNYDKPKA